MIIYNEWIEGKYGRFKVLNKLKNKYNIEFEDGYTTIVVKSQILLKTIKTPYFKSVYNLGFLGKKYNSTHFLYHIWYDMLYRCYNSNSNIFKYYGAKGISVDIKWHSFENFVDDVIYIEEYNKQSIINGLLVLDKDVKVNNNKIYSKTTCSWISKSENSIEMSLRTQQKYFIATRLEDGFSIRSNNQKQFAIDYDLTPQNINRCLHNKAKTHKGWKFVYDNH